MSYEIFTGTTYTRIDQFDAQGMLVEVIYVHRSEYRHWDA